MSSELGRLAARWRRPYDRYFEDLHRESGGLVRDALRLWLDVNGERRQDSSTRELVFGVPEIVRYLSEFMTLLPGDVISTGTPAGVAMGRKPPTYLKEGDVVEYGIDGLGRARQRVVRYGEARA